jgi:predicted PhzF superfamily epimerase YddE/YHI9
LRVRRRQEGAGYILDLPALIPGPIAEPGNAIAAFGCDSDAFVAALDLIAVFSAPGRVAEFRPNLPAMAELPLRAVIVTAPGEGGGDIDFVSRWFAAKPGGSGEDIGITGSAHCQLVPYWARRLGKNRLRARQLSPRGGVLDCELSGDRVLLFCAAVKYMEGSIYL